MDRELRSITFENWGGGPYIVEVWGVKRDGPDAGSKWWPNETIKTPLPQKGEDYDWSVAHARLAELEQELSWVAVA